MNFTTFKLHTKIKPNGKLACDDGTLNGDSEGCMPMVAAADDALALHQLLPIGVALESRVTELEAAWRGEKDLHFKSGERVKDLEHALEVCEADARRVLGASHEELVRALQHITMTACNAIHGI